MCARYTLTTADLAALAKEWAAEVDEGYAARWRPRWNAAPGNALPVLTEEGGARRLGPARFGLDAPRGAFHLNARVETAAEKRTFREAWRRRRAVVPADGFYEWDGPPSRRRPHWLHRPDGRLLLMAGLWERHADGSLAFAVVTTEARGVVRRLHDRMPVILPEGLVGAWLAAGEPPPLPEPDEALLAEREVSPRVNSVAHDDPSCLEPPPAAAQLTLL